MSSGKGLRRKQKAARVTARREAFAARLTGLGMPADVVAVAAADKRARDQFMAVGRVVMKRRPVPYHPKHFEAIRAWPAK